MTGQQLETTADHRLEGKRKSRPSCDEIGSNHASTMDRENAENQRSKELKQIDWTFADSDSRDGVHSIHPYPAKFIPQVPRKLIELYANDSSVVLDPFSGSGTTLVEALKQKHDCVGIDIHPLACLISRVKTQPLPQEFTSTAREVVTTARQRFPEEEIEPPELPNIDHWFEKPIQKALTVLTEEISAIDHLETREALQVALSSIIVRVSNQDSDTRYAAVEKDVSAEDVFRQFARAASRIEEAFLKDDDWRRSDVTCSVLNRDVLDVKPDDIPQKVDLVVTSPPYPNAYEYWLYHKYRMYWLGLGDPTNVKEHEIGARPHYHGSDPQDEKDFQRQMSTLFSLLSEIMTADGKACFVIGRSKIRGREIDNAVILEEAAEPSGFELTESVPRQIPSDSKSFNPGYSKINDEKILIFDRREDQ